MRIERIGSEMRLPGVRVLEWHEAGEPDGHFFRLPLPDIVCTINFGVVGRYRLSGACSRRAFPRVALRGVSRAPSEGWDPPRGRIGYLSLVVAPWALPVYAGVHAGEIADTIVDGAACDSSWSLLYEQLESLSDGLARLDALEQWLAGRAAAPTWCARTRAVVNGLREDHAVATVARAAALSARSVHRLCVATTGHNPSTYRKIARFARLAQALHHDAGAHTWSHHVQEYADHSHAIREFRRLSSVTPRQYAAQRDRVARTFSISRQPDATALI